ncbi:hypothetical protein BDR26DRAFT_930235 [Obelidium mucronatum]|nr:hypothetical protein BDR26DRAFT_930235 [Obelidium mucronatum]
MSDQKETEDKSKYPVLNAPPVGSLIAIAIPEEAKKAVMATVKDYVAPAAVGAYFASNYGARLEARQGEKKALDVAAKKLEVIGEEEMDPNNEVHKAALAAYEAYVPLQEATYRVYMYTQLL